MPGLQEKKKVLIVVRTYPTPARQSVEVSCTAGITEQGDWIRLFPVPFRFLEYDQRFAKYQWIEVSVTKSNDPRPESYKISSDSISILSATLPTDNGWKARKDLVFPLKAPSLCSLQRERDSKGFPTLGVFRPKIIKRLIIDEDESEWTAEQLGALRQTDLFGAAPKQELEKVPHNFRYDFVCDEDNCTGHRLSCTDWEIGEAWRRWKRDYGSDWEGKFRQRFEEEMINKYDTHFFVGTVRGHPNAWIIIGLFYPPKPKYPETLPLYP